jgi:hypothetical protein
MPWSFARRAPVRPVLAWCLDRIFHPKLHATLHVSTIVMFLLLGGNALAQSSASLFLETPQGKIPIPTSTGRLGQREEAALTEVVQHLTAVGSTPWAGMQGTGKINYGSDVQNSFNATLSNLGGHNFRLDAQTKKGEMSIRIRDRLGKIRSGDGVMSNIPPDTAMVGLFPFQLPRLGSFPRPGTSLVDHGLSNIGGTNLRRITFEFAGMGRNPTTKMQETTAIDLYFDPTSHLLVRSSAYVLIPETRNLRLLSVVTYADYRKVGSSLIPFRYVETMEGQPYWTLQLSEVHLNPSLNATYFEF